MLQTGEALLALRLPWQQLAPSICCLLLLFCRRFLAAALPQEQKQEQEEHPKMPRDLCRCGSR